MRKRICLILIVTLILSMLVFPVHAASPDVQTRNLPGGQTRTIAPYWDATSQIIHGISIGAGGNSTVSVNYYTYSSTDRIQFTATLQKLSGSSWSSEKSWSASGTGAAYLSQAYTVSSGTYRVMTVGTVRDKNGNYVETVTVYSTSKSY